MSDDPTNADRADWARVALDAFGAETGQAGYDYGDPEHVAEIAGDLICNLLHVARAAGLDPEQLIENARGHFDDEDQEEPAGPGVCGVKVELRGLGTYPCVIPDDGAPGIHAGDCQTQPELDGLWPPTAAGRT